MLVAFSVWPSGAAAGDFFHDAVAAAVKVVRASGLPNRTSAYGNRVELVLKADIRPGHANELTGKVERLEQAIARQPWADSKN